MATWYATASGTNFDATGLWNNHAAGTGSDTLTFGTHGTADIFVANGKTNIAINVDPAVPAGHLTAYMNGGSFTVDCTLGLTINANVTLNTSSGSAGYAGTLGLVTLTGTAGTTTIAGTVNCATTAANVNAISLKHMSGALLQINGNVINNATGSNTRTLHRFSGTTAGGSVIINGNVSNGSSNYNMLFYSGMNNLIINGDVTQNVNVNTIFLSNSPITNLTVNGNVDGFGNSNSVISLSSAQATNVTINGDVEAQGVTTVANSTLLIYGKVRGSLTTVGNLGGINCGGGTVTILGDVFGQKSVGVFVTAGNLHIHGDIYAGTANVGVWDGSGYGITVYAYGSLITGTTGYLPVSANLRWTPRGNKVYQYLDVNGRVGLATMPEVAFGRSKSCVQQQPTR